jgi:hypothetical protein
MVLYGAQRVHLVADVAVTVAVTSQASLSHVGGKPIRWRGPA